MEATARSDVRASGCVRANDEAKGAARQAVGRFTTRLGQRRYLAYTELRPVQEEIDAGTLDDAR